MDEVAVSGCDSEEIRHVFNLKVSPETSLHRHTKTWH